MSLPVNVPLVQTRLVDDGGILTTEGHLMLLRMASALIEAQAEVDALKSRVDALEAP